MSLNVSVPEEYFAQNCNSTFVLNRSEANLSAIQACCCGKDAASATSLHCPVWGVHIGAYDVFIVLFLFAGGCGLLVFLLVEVLLCCGFVDEGSWCPSARE